MYRNPFLSYCLLLHEQEEYRAEICGDSDGDISPVGYPCPAVLQSEHIQDYYYAEDDINDPHYHGQGVAFGRDQQINSVRRDKNAEREEYPGRNLIGGYYESYADYDLYDSDNKTFRRVLISEIVHYGDQTETRGDYADDPYQQRNESERSVKEQDKRAYYREYDAHHSVDGQIHGKTCRDSFVPSLSFTFTLCHLYYTPLYHYR